MDSHVDPAKNIIAGLSTLLGNGLCWAQSFEYGVIASAITSIGLALAGAWILIGQARAKSYATVEEARLKADAERDRVMGPSITRQLELMQRQMAEDAVERQRMARQLEISESDKHRLMLKLTESVDRANETMQGNTDKINKIAREIQSGPLVLIVEDDRETSGQMVRLLKSRGYRVDFASDVPTSISKLLNNPRFVILDVMLPNGSGFDVLREIRTRHMDTKVIVCSALDHGDPSYAALAADLMPDFTVRKPVDVGILLAYLRDASAPRPHLSDIDLPRLSGDDLPVNLAKPEKL